MNTLVMTSFGNTLSELSVTVMNYVWNNDRKSVVLELKNIGNSDSGPIIVEFDLEKDDEFNSSLPHIQKYLNNLKMGDTVCLTADFNEFKSQILNNADKMIIHIEGLSCANHLRTNGRYGTENKR